jgi:large subunit ribosomal protein L10
MTSLPPPPSITPDKKAAVDAMRDKITRMTAAVLLDFRGIDVETVTSLRAEFRKAGVDYSVVKNTLFKKALIGTPQENNAALKKLLTGPTGIAFSYDDPSAGAKVVKAFRSGGEKHEKLQIKGGLIETTIVPGDKVESQLATLPGKNEIRAMLLAQLLAPMQKLVMQLSAPAQNVAYALSARERQLGEQK